MSAALTTSPTLETSTTLETSQGQKPMLLADLSFEDPAVGDDDRTWVDVRTRVRGEASITRGRGSELDTVEPAVVSLLLENRDSEFSPENTGGAHYGDLVPMRRLWLRCQYDGETQDLFKGYVEAFDPDWPDAGFDNVCRVTAVDGTKVLSLWKLEAPEREPSMIVYGTGGYSRMRVTRPPGAFAISDPYAIRVLKDKPWVYYRLNEKSGGSRMFDSSGQGHGGKYGNTPTFGADPLIAGVTKTAVTFASASSEYARSTLGAFPEGSTASVTFWVKPTTISGDQEYFSSSITLDSGPSTVSFRIYKTSANAKVRVSITYNITGAFVGEIATAVSTTDLEADTTMYVAATYDGSDLKLYVNGLLEATTAQAGSLQVTAQDDIWIATGVGGGDYANATMDEIAVFDKALTDQQIEQHFQIGSLGFTQDVSGTRIGEALDQAEVFGVRTLHAGERDLLPVAYASGSALDVIQQAVYSEGIPALFYFNRSGQPVFLDRGYRSDAPYTTTQVTFGQGGGGEEWGSPLPLLLHLLGGEEESMIPYTGLEIATGDAFLYNEVRTGRDEEDAVPQVVEDATSKGRYLTRVYEKTGMICTTDANTLTEAETLLARFKDPFTRVVSVDLTLHDGLGTIDGRHAINRLLGLELGEKVVVNRTDRYGAATLSQTSYVEADDLRIAPGAAGWTMRLGISPR